MAGRQVRRLTMDAFQDGVEAGHPRLLVEAAAELSWQYVQQSSVNGLNTTKRRRST